MTQQTPQDQHSDRDANKRPDAVDDGPPQIRESSEGGAPDRQIAQESQQSTGLGPGQS